MIDWTNEEGSRFAPAMLASGVFAGVFTRDYADSRKDREGKSFGEELDRIGYRGTEKAGDHKLGAFFELHIEQGPILEDEEKVIGVVTGVQGMRWYEVTVTGFRKPCRHHADASAQATRWSVRARMVEAIDKVALDHPPLAVSTVGLMEVRPNSRNVLPGEVFFTIDLRHPEDEVVDAMEAEVKAAIERIAEELKLEIKVEQVWDSPPSKFDPACVECGADGGCRERVQPPGDRFRRRARCGLHGAGGADGDDLHPLRRGHQPQRDREGRVRARGGRGECPAAGGAGVRQPRYASDRAA